MVLLRYRYWPLFNFLRRNLTSCLLLNRGHISFTHVQLQSHVVFKKEKKIFFFLVFFLLVYAFVIILDLTPPLPLPLFSHPPFLYFQNDDMALKKYTNHTIASRKYIVQRNNNIKSHFTVR